jgi:hypothetical protein
MSRGFAISFLAIFWLLMAGFIASVAVPINVPHFVKLLEHGERTKAEIVRTDCGQHDSAYYRFRIGADNYTSGSQGVENCRALRPGDVIDVYYDVRDPANNSTNMPLNDLINELSAIGLACLVFPPLVFFMLRRRSLIPTR